MSRLDVFRARVEGQSLVEFAMASVVFFTLIFGIIQFGQAVWQYNTVSHLAQDGARWASVRGRTSSTPASSADLQSFVESRSPGFTVVVTSTPANPSDAPRGSAIAVRVVSTYAPGGFLPIAPMNFESTATMMMTR